MLAVTYPNREKAVYVDRLEWARSYCKLGGALESPKRGLFLLTPEGMQIVSLPEAGARDRLAKMDAEVRSRRRGAGAADATAAETGTGNAPVDEDDKTVQGPGWKEQLLARLHRLSPEGFEEFALVLLRAYGLQLQRTGGMGDDQGIDGIGTAPLSAVLSATVAVRAKRWDPLRTVSREVVALFQRDASAAGAERAVMVTLARYSEPARRAATSATPTVDLIDGDRLCELARDAELGVRPVPTVDESGFDRFGNE